MKTLFAFTSIALALCVVGNQQHAAAQWPEATSHEPTVTVEFGAIAFDREGSSSSPVTASDTVTNSSVLTDEQATDLGSAAGVQGKIIFPSRRTGHTLELRGSYTGWDQDFTVANDNLSIPFLLEGVLQLSELVGVDLASPVNPVLPIGLTAADLAIPDIPLNTGAVSPLSLVWPGLPPNFFAEGITPPTLEDIFDVESISSRYQSDYSSVELMSRRNTRPGVTWLFGPRFVSVTEESQITLVGTSPTRIFFPIGAAFDDTGAPITPISTDQASAAARTETRNSLIGLQLGLEFNMPVTQDIYFQISGRGGAFYNASSVDRAASPLARTSNASDGAFTLQSSDSDSGESWLAEINIRGYVDLIPNTLSAYAGYDVLYIDQLALAPAQTASVDSVDKSSDLFARGFSFGVKMNY